MTRATPGIGPALGQSHTGKTSHTLGPSLAARGLSEVPLCPPGWPVADRPVAGSVGHREGLGLPLPWPPTRLAAPLPPPGLSPRAVSRRPAALGWTPGRPLRGGARLGLGSPRALHPHTGWEHTGGRRRPPSPPWREVRTAASGLTVRQASGNSMLGELHHGSRARPGVQGQVAFQPPPPPPAPCPGQQAAPALQRPWGLMAGVGVVIPQNKRFA